jgi:hypothetical protein
MQQNFPNPKAKRKNSSSLPSSSLKTRLLKDKEKKNSISRTLKATLKGQLSIEALKGLVAFY